MRPFLLHLSPQIALTKSGATDYLDGHAGIVRSAQEKLEKRVNAVARSLGKERTAQRVASFMTLDRERMSRGLLAKLESLPVVNGRPDTSGIADPIGLAKQWAEEMKLNPAEILDRLLAHLEERGNG